MKIGLLFFTLILPVICNAQIDAAHLKKESNQTFVYRISAILAEKYIKTDSIDVDSYLSQHPFTVLDSGRLKNGSLPPGHYVLLSVQDNFIVASLLGVSDLNPYTTNNQKQVQLFLGNKAGNVIANAGVWINNKKVNFNAATNSFWIPNKNPDGALIKIYAGVDTTFISLTADGNLRRSVSQQRWYNILHSKMVNLLTLVPKRIIRLFKQKSNYSVHSIGAKGIMIFNQPKYKLTDTVKLKAYVFNKRSVRYSRVVNVFLSYSTREKRYEQYLTSLKPQSPGSFIYNFPLSDTLVSDTKYDIVFKTSSDKKVFSGSFKIEDYLPDEVTHCKIRSSQQSIYINDTFHLYASATNANGLALLDARAVLVLTTNAIEGFFKDSMQVPDTLFVEEKKLLTEGETVFDVPTAHFPRANLRINAKVTFKNSNNELQDKDLPIQFDAVTEKIWAFEDIDTIRAEYRLNGKSTTASGFVIKEGDDTLEITYPFKTRLDPMTSAYTFHITGKEHKTDPFRLDIDGDHDVYFKRISAHDTMGFELYNAKKLSVTYSIWDGNKLVYAKTSESELIRWQSAAINRRKMYLLKWEYYYGGEEHTKEEKIALLYKLLNITVQSNKIVFPGQTDTIGVDVKDYRDKPVANVNLTALSYNNQLNKDINVREPPYLVTYHQRPSVIIDKFEQDNGYILKKYFLGKHVGWVAKFGLDTVPYYHALFPNKSYTDLVTPITEFAPQVSVHVVKQGIKQAVYLLYLNRNLVYYHGVTDRSKDAYTVNAGLTQFGIRLYDRFISLDSIYLQPFYKHDLFIDLDHLPKNKYAERLHSYLSVKERSLLENSLWLLHNNYRTNKGYVWQDDKLVHLTADQQHIVGPFRKNDSLHFYVPGDFDVHFIYEAGYEYDLSPKIYRLEKSKVFAPWLKKIYLPKINNPAWIIGDTLDPVPTINYDKITGEATLQTSVYQDWTVKTGSGRLKFTVRKDTLPSYIILYSKTEGKVKLILNGTYRDIKNIEPGSYCLLIISKHRRVLETPSVIIQANKTLCIHTENIAFNDSNSILNEVINQPPKVTVKPVLKSADSGVLNYEKEGLYEYAKGTGSVSGRVIDQRGRYGIAYVLISIAGTKTGTLSTADGSFAIKNIQTGKCILVFSSVGYNTKQVAIAVEEELNPFLNVELLPSLQSLQEVVVTGFGIRKKDLVGSVSYFKEGEVSNTLAGKIAGLSVSAGQPGSSGGLMIRGISGMLSGSPVYIIDGIFYDRLPSNISQDMISDLMVLQATEAIAVYGARASQGAVIVSTKTKSVRNHFRDYAFWQPELFTDRNGKASFVVTYPDNATGWRTFILGMDRKRHMGKTETFVKAYKPLLSELSEPPFLIEGDSVSIVGKALNYSNDNYQLKTSFTANDKITSSSFLIKSNASEIQKFMIIAPPGDSLSANFSIQTTTGFKDAEERTIPVFKRGTEEVNGEFYVLTRDTIVSFTDPKAKNVELFVQNNTIDLLLTEIEDLKKYPYFCMEQTASKLRGLLMEKKIKENLGQHFTEQQMISFLVKKIQQFQLFEGGWGWWANGKPDIYISNYVINALSSLRSNTSIETSIRNGLLFLQNNLSISDKGQLLLTLTTMSNCNHVMDYLPWIEKIRFDSLDSYQQWLFVKLKQQLHLQHSNELEQVMKRAVYGFTGSLHYGGESWHWYNTANITTALAFDVLLQEKGYRESLTGMVQYFLEQRSGGHWINTVESASIVSSILPFVLSINADFIQPSLIDISGDTILTINQFPYKKFFTPNTIHNLKIIKKGGGITYVSLYRKSFNNNPEPVDKYFNLRSSFEKDHQQITALTAGEKCTLKVDVNALKDAEYVMIEIPIPAGCTYSTKVQDEPGMHKEFFKNKVVIFSEHLSKGDHQFSIVLEPRYTGTFAINPAKIALMYFPVFYGRNGVKEVRIQ